MNSLGTRFEFLVRDKVYAVAVAGKSWCCVCIANDEPFKVSFGMSFGETSRESFVLGWDEYCLEHTPTCKYTQCMACHPKLPKKVPIRLCSKCVSTMVSEKEELLRVCNVDLDMNCQCRFCKIRR